MMTTAFGYEITEKGVLSKFAQTCHSMCSVEDIHKSKGRNKKYILYLKIYNSKRHPWLCSKNIMRIYPTTE